MLKKVQDLYSVKEIAELLGLCSKTVRSYILKGKIKQVYVKYPNGPIPTSERAPNQRNANYTYAYLQPVERRPYRISRQEMEKLYEEKCIKDIASVYAIELRPENGYTKITCRQEQFTRHEKTVNRYRREGDCLLPDYIPHSPFYDFESEENS